MHRISLLTLLGTIGLSVLGHAPAKAIDDNYGWGNGTATARNLRKTEPPRAFSSAQAAALTPSESLHSAASAPSLLSATLDSLIDSEDIGKGASEPNLSALEASQAQLRRENETLRRKLAQQALSKAANETFDPREEAALSFRWFNLSAGYPDPTSMNYDSMRRQYYDVSTDVFPPKQPPFSSLKKQVGPEVKAWDARVNKAREAYKEAYLDMERKQKRLARKAAEDLTNTLDTLNDSVILEAAPSTVAEKKDGKANKKEEILEKAKADAKVAELTFKKMQESFLHEHPAGIRDVAGERQIIRRSQEDLDRHFTWGHIDRPLEIAYRFPPAQRNDPANIRALSLTDPMEIQVGIHMLSWMIPHLERELAIFRDIRTRYSRDFAPRVSGGYFSPTAWSDWYYGSSATSLKGELKRNYPSVSIAHFPLPQTYNEVTFRLLRLDELGLKLRTRYLSGLKRYKDTPISNLLEKFYVVYQGSDQVSVTDIQTTTTTNKAKEIRRFPKPLSTPIATVRTRLQPAPEQEFVEGDAPPQNSPVPFVLPKKAQMATEFVAPEAMGFHKSLWPQVMDELIHTKGRPLVHWGKGGAKEYRALLGQYETLLKDTSAYLKPFQTPDTRSLPAPWTFFFVNPDPEQVVAPDTTTIDLSTKGITDQDLTTLRHFQGGVTEPVLRHYSSINLSGNSLQSLHPETVSPSLTNLNISKNKLTGLQWVTTLTELKDLDVSLQLLNDLTPFGSEGVKPLPKLEKLNLAHTGLSEISPLAGFTALTVLNLSRNNIASLASLKGLTALKELYLARNALTTLDDLEPLKQLRVLDVSYNPISTLKIIAHFEFLQLLAAETCKFSGSWSGILPVSKGASGTRFFSLLLLQLKGNNSIEWTPYVSKSAYSSQDVQNNNLDFQLTFPALKTLEVGANTKLEATTGKAITLSMVESNKF